MSMGIKLPANTMVQDPVFQRYREAPLYIGPKPGAPAVEKTEQSKLQFLTAANIQQEIGVLVTNTAQLDQRQGRPSSIEAIMKELGVEPPTREELDSPQSVDAYQAKVQQGLQGLPSERVQAIADRLEAQFSQLLTQSGTPKGATLDTSA
jgi:hypothetical protein